MPCAWAARCAGAAAGAPGCACGWPGWRTHSAAALHRPQRCGLPRAACWPPATEGAGMAGAWGVALLTRRSSLRPCCRRGCADRTRPADVATCLSHLLRLSCPVPCDAQPTSAWPSGAARVGWGGGRLCWQQRQIILSPGIPAAAAPAGDLCRHHPRRAGDAWVSIFAEGVRTGRVLIAAGWSGGALSRLGRGDRCSPIAALS